MARSKDSSKKKRESRAPTLAPLDAARAGGGQGDSILSRSAKRTILIAASVGVALTVAGALAIQSSIGRLRTALGGVAGEAAATFVGSETCAGCHQAEAGLWRRSHHQLAMQHATDKTVSGDFDGASLDHHGTHSRFFREDGKFLVETDGPDGGAAKFEIKYTFGVDPLQQYLIEFPDGRLQALSIAWDSRPKEAGGQRWFHLYPNEDIRHDDVLHWTRLNQNWNFMCAGCHSTGVRKNYDATNDRFATTWAEISVGCEACHGQGSGHVGWARDQKSLWPFGRRDDPEKGLIVRFDERRDVVWRRDPSAGSVQRNSTPTTLRKEVETCGLCHARRGEFSEDWVPGRRLTDTHVVSPLARGLYHADGQMLDEVYDYGSFKQSKMFAAGVTCSDCHEPHGATLRVPGDGVCLQCHSPDTYAAVTHHRHAEITPKLACASCHMPERTYMVVDRRHDHSFRIPRPDLSARLGTPNACNDCHSDKPAAWAASAIEGWHGASRKGFQTYAEAFHAARTNRADAAALLSVVAADRNVPAIARATALSELGSRISPSNINLARAGLSDPEPMVRIGALDMLENVPAAQLWPLVAPLLTDSSRGVRIRAAALLAGVPTASQPPADRQRFERAAAEFIAAQRLNADRPEARSALGNFLARRGQPADAEAEYQAALRLSAQYVPAAINLADVYRQLGRESQGENVLRTALTASPHDAGLHYALGLTLVRFKRLDEALEHLRGAAEIEPDRARYAYVYAVALHSAGRAEDALAILKENLARHPSDRETLMALVSFHREARHTDLAVEYAEQLALIIPEDRDIARLIQDLRQQGNRPGQ